MATEPLTADQCDGVLGAIVTSLETTGNDELVALAEALRSGGQLTTSWDEEDGVYVSLAVPAGHPLNNAEYLEDAAFDFVTRAVATCGRRVVRVRITLALAKTGWRSLPKEDLPTLLAGRFQREADPLKRGGFGIVYKAHDVMTGTDVAVKVLRLPADEGPRVREQYYLRFRREMQLMSSLSHPNLMSVLWFGQEENGVLWYAMPLAEGSLVDRITEFPADANRILAVLASICDGVAYLHEQGVIHRDLSPGNVLCLPDGSWVVSDLGLAFDLDRELTQLTMTGMSMGTAGYRPPDVEAQMAKTATVSWDVFSLGQIVSDMSAGLVFKDRNGLHSESIFKTAIARACHPDADRRFTSVRELLDECRRLAELSTSWEGPAERRERVITALSNAADPNDRAKVVHELAQSVEQGESIEPFASGFCEMSNDVVVGLATSAREDLRTLTLKILDELPGSYTPFAQLDDLARFVIAAAEALADDIVSEETLRWVLEVGHDWNRWNVQGQANAYLRRLAETSLDVVARALSQVDRRALPHDLDWLHPAARPDGYQPVDTESF